MAVYAAFLYSLQTYFILCLTIAPYDPNAPHGVKGHLHTFGEREEMTNSEHIKQHFDSQINTENMEKEKLLFYYFKMHDIDNNNLVDGVEMVKSFTHEHSEDGTHTPKNEVLPDDTLESMVDSILNSVDINRDGFIDWSEYKKMAGD